jgi:hypothetical protein
MLVPKPVAKSTLLFLIRVGRPVEGGHVLSGIVLQTSSSRSTRATAKRAHALISPWDRTREIVLACRRCRLALTPSMGAPKTVLLFPWWFLTMLGLRIFRRRRV